MSMHITIFTCEDCGEEWYSSVIWGMYWYELDTGRILPMERDLGWCCDCAAMKPVEVLPDKEEYITRVAVHQTELDFLDPQGKSWFSRLCFALSKKRKKKLRKIKMDLKQAEVYLWWLKRRENPPRCLHCGSLDILPVNSTIIKESDGAEKLKHFRHPGCGGVIRISHSDARISSGRHNYLYDEQGLFRREGKLGWNVYG